MSTWTGRRTLGRSGIEVSALGMGRWAIGGPFWYGDKPVAQVEENAGALELGPLTAAQADEIGKIITEES